MTMNKYNILYIVSTLRDCGPINQLYGLIKNLDKSLFSPKILTLSSEPLNSQIDQFRELAVPIESLALSRIEMMLKGKGVLERKLKGMEFDLIHTSGIRADSFVERYSGEEIHLNTIRNYPYDDYPVKFGRLLGTYMAKKHLALFSKIAYPVSCSFAIADILKSRHKFISEVVQNGIDANKYSPVDTQMKEDIRKRLGLSLDKLIFITVGSLIKRKDPLTLIEGFIKADLDNALLLVLGEGPLLDKCQEYVDDRILLKGQIDNVSNYLKAADVFVSASHSEGLPNAVLEAMGTGLPVLLSDIAPHSEILKEDAGMGELFFTGDSVNLSSYLKKWTAYDLKEMGNRARKALEESFSAKVMSRNYQELYQKILLKSQHKNIKKIC